MTAVCAQMHTCKYVLYWQKSLQEKHTSKAFTLAPEGGVSAVYILVKHLCKNVKLSIDFGSWFSETAASIQKR